MKKVVNKGYTLEVTSWENDADNYRTILKTVQNKEEALALGRMCTQLLKSKNDRENPGLGNAIDLTLDQEEKILKFVEENPFLFNSPEKASEEALIDQFTDLAGELMGWSEFYTLRVCESCEISYSNEDIFVKKVDIEPKEGKVFSKEDFPNLDHIHDEILDEYEIGEELDFQYDGKFYNAKVEHDGTYWEYGMKGREVIITEKQSNGKATDS